MSNTWHTNMQHVLDENGELVAMPGSGRRLWQYFFIA
jgi:hypothetical protein